jgi:hypothetical protein
MKSDPETIKQIEVGSVVQISPEYDRLEMRGLFGRVTDVKSWGVMLAIHVPDEAVAGVEPVIFMRLTWNLIEPTGGKAVWDATGARLTEAPKPMRHHP